MAKVCIVFIMTQILTDHPSIQAFLSPFSQPSQRTKKVLEKGTTRSTAKASTSAATKDFLHVQQESNVNEADDLDDAEPVEIDQAQFEHDTLVIQDTVLEAIEQMSASHGVTPTGSQLREAQSIMTAVSKSL